MGIVTRFPPSPTGFMHIGNARTALFNWLYARHSGGKFVVRIEDTDRKRHSEEAVQAIIRGLEWLELDVDGEITSQFANLERHAQVAQNLLDEGKAYHCYCSPDELDEMRKTARQEGKQSFYDRRWRDKGASDEPDGIKPVVRIKAPLEGASTINDKVQGEVTVQNENLDDFIIMRSDGTPTYMLSVVVDDHDMGVTHILRGDDHLNNTFRQKIIFDAMGWSLPEFAHLPLIHGADGAKFSKRHGATSVEEYRDMGYLPEAMRNYLLRLGWGHGDDEIISTEQAIEWFGFDGMGKSASRFDYAKLESLNAHYMTHIDNDRLMGFVAPFFKERHDIELNEQSTQRIIEGIDELKDRAKTLLQFVDEAAFYAKELPLDYDEKAQKNLSVDAIEVLSALEGKFKAQKQLDSETVEQCCREVADTLKDGKLGKVMMPLRAAVTGTSVSPSVFHAVAILGANETCARIQSAINWIQNTCDGNKLASTN